MTDSEIKEKVRKIMFENMVKGYSPSAKKSYHYTAPSTRPYTSQYFWDTCFHAFIFTALGEHRIAQNHMRSLFALQEENGFVGHILYWDQMFPKRITDIFQSRPSLGTKILRTHMSALLQPPLAAQAVLTIYNNDKDKLFLHFMFPKLKKYYNWLARNRDFEGDGLLSIISPFESGMDWKPSFDSIVGFERGKANWKLFVKMVNVDFKNFLSNYDIQTIRRKNYFIVKEVGFNTIYVQNLYAMAELCEFMNDTDAGWYRTQAGKVIKNMLAVMYDEKDAAFYDVYGKEHRKIKVLTPTIFFPVVIKGLDESLCRTVLQRHLFNKDEFEAPFPIPSVAKKDPSFNPNASLYIWRGPTWSVYNWFMFQFLKEKGYDEEAIVLYNCMRTLIEKSGFREYYDPFSGEGYGAENFTWSGLIVDMMNK